MPDKAEVRLRLDARKAPAGTIRELADVVRSFPGEAQVVLDLETSVGPQRYVFGPEFRVRPEADFFAEVKALLGEAAEEDAEREREDALRDPDGESGRGFGEVSFEPHLAFEVGEDALDHEPARGQR